MPIETLYLANHSHTDICFTDHQDIVFRQHGEFIDQALDLIEATADHPEEARYRWTCEASGVLERWLRAASPEQLDRFRHWHERGHMDVTAMQYPHFTQALTNEQAARMLYTVRTFREDYGLTVDSGVQSDVTGSPWRFADLLPAAGIDFMTMAINMHRALAPEPRPGGFWWEGPSGGRLLVWNGLFYVWGRSLARIGDWRFIDRFLPDRLAQIEGNGYEHDFLYAAITHPTRVDNGPPDARIPDFVRDWNAQGRTPRMELVTVSGFGRRLREEHGDDLPTVRGDWTDWWTNGYGADARSVGVNRAARHVFATSEDLEAWLHAVGRDGWDRDRAKYVQDRVILAEDLVWGAFSSYFAADSLYTRSHYAYKLNDVYTASMECHDLLARASNRLADTVSERGPDGVFNLGDLDPEEAYPPSGATELLVFNALPWDRDVIVEEPELRGNTAPVGILEMFFPRDVPWGGVRPIGPVRRVVGRVPGLGYAWLPLADAPGDDDLVVGPGVIENAHYRVRIDPATGGLAEWLDKDLGHDFAGEYQGWRPGQYVYEWIDDPRGRDAQFVLDFSRIDCGIRHTDTPYVRETVTGVTVGEPTIAHGRASITVDVTARGIRTGSCTFALDTRTKVLEVDWSFDKDRTLDAESVYFAFPFNLGAPTFTLDMGGAAVRADEDQIAGSCRDWYPAQKWVSVSDGERTVVVAPLDSPLVQLGGVTIQRWASHLEPDGPNVMAWPLNNHWDVNFLADQHGAMEERYRLTTHAGPHDEVGAARWGAEQFAVPIVMRDRLRSGPEEARLLSLADGDDALVSAKPAEDGRGIILRVENLRRDAQTVRVHIHAAPLTEAILTTPIEDDVRPLEVDGDAVVIPLPGLGFETVRVLLS